MFVRNAGKTVPLLAALLVTMGLAAPAQTPGGGMQSPTVPPGSQPGTSVNQGPPTANQDSPEMRMQNMQDSEFVRRVLDDNDAQVEMSRLAQQKSTSDDVKQFSGQMVQVHTQLNQQMKTLAGQLDVDQPKKFDKREKKEMDQLQSLTGPAFETAYLQDMVAEQQRSLKLFQKETKNGGKSSTALTAKQDVPVLEQHFQILEKIAQAHNVPTDSSQKK